MGPGCCPLDCSVPAPRVVPRGKVLLVFGIPSRLTHRELPCDAPHRRRIFSLELVESKSLVLKSCTKLFKFGLLKFVVGAKQFKLPFIWLVVPQDS